MLISTGSLKVRSFSIHGDYLKKPYIDFALVRKLNVFGREPVIALEERSLKTQMKYVKNLLIN